MRDLLLVSLIVRGLILFVEHELCIKETDVNVHTQMGEIELLDKAYVGVPVQLEQTLDDDCVSE